MSHPHVLSPEQHRMTLEALSELNRAIDIINRLEKCGRDCTGHKADVERLIRELQAFRDMFGSTAGTVS